MRHKLKAVNKTVDDLWLDSCAYIHAALTGPTSADHVKLAEDIGALKVIKDLYRNGGVELGMPLNTLREVIVHPDYLSAEAYWRDKPPATYPQGIGLEGHRISSKNVSYESARGSWEAKLVSVAGKVGDYPGRDTAILLNCAFFGGMLITTDYKFLNRLRNEGRSITFLNALRPFEYVKRLHA